MRTQQRGVSITAAPPEWRLSCRRPLFVEVRSGIRKGARSWWREYVELMDEGFVHCPGTRTERREAQSIHCRCGDEMSLRAFELIGDEGELVARRTYALCVMCGEWAEF